MDLTTTYMGLRLKNPLVPSSSPLTQSIESLKRLEDAGAAAVVLYSLFEEQILLESHQLDHHLSYFTDAFAESLDFFPDLGMYNIGPEKYLDLIRLAKESLDIPVIASLNGVTPGGWVHYARLMEAAGADALELNIYYIPATVEMSSTEVESRYSEVVKAVRADVSIPLSVKIGPYFSAPGAMMKELAQCGAKGLVLFNRFYQPDLDIEELNVVPHLVLSDSNDLRLPLRWVAMMYGQVFADFAITGGVHTAADVMKAMMAGANVTYLASALLIHGPTHLQTLLTEMEQWMASKEYESIQQMRGSLSQRHAADPDAFERANYMKVLASWRSDPAGKGYSTSTQGS